MSRICFAQKNAGSVHSVEFSGHSYAPNGEGVKLCAALSALSEFMTTLALGRSFVAVTKKEQGIPFVEIEWSSPDPVLDDAEKALACVAWKLEKTYPESFKIVDREGGRDEEKANVECGVS